MYINGEEQQGDIYFQEMYYNLDKVIKIAIFTILIIGILTLISIAIYYNKKISVEKAFWMIIPIMFITFLIAVPAFKSHDEAYHWFRSYDIAQGNYLAQVIDDRATAVAGEDILNVTNLVPENINYTFIINTIKNGLENNNTAELSLETTAVYSPVQYLPQTLRNITCKYNFK